MSFNFDDVVIEISNEEYSNVLPKINKAFPDQSEEVFLTTIGPLMGIFIGFSNDVSKRVLDSYKEYLLNTYPELKKYKL